MNDQTAHLMDDFCVKSANYSLPGAVQAHIYCLEYLVKEWYKLTHQSMNLEENYCIYKENLISNIHKTVINLIEKISQCRILSGDLVKIFNNVVVNYIDSTSLDEFQMKELSNLFSQVSLSERSETN